VEVPLTVLSFGDGDAGGGRNAARAMWSDRAPEVGVNNDIPTESRTHPNGWGAVQPE